MYYTNLTRVGISTRWVGISTKSVRISTKSVGISTISVGTNTKCVGMHTRSVGISTKSVGMCTTSPAGEALWLGQVPERHCKRRIPRSFNEFRRKIVLIPTSHIQKRRYLHRAQAWTWDVRSTFQTTRDVENHVFKCLVGISPVWLG